MSTRGSRAEIARELSRLMAAEDAVIRTNDPALLDGDRVCRMEFNLDQEAVLRARWIP
jgi:hypothetical protein